jgi:lysophospholipase L1-like esterase
MTTSILCYGDSNTWGYIPGGHGQRLNKPDRWPSILNSALGSNYDVIENGVNGRTINLPEPEKPWRNGLNSLLATLHAHKPLDWVFILLGNNDLKPTHQQTSQMVATQLNTLVTHVKKSCCGHQNKAPAVLVIAPPSPNITGLAKNPEFSVDMAEASRQLSEQLAKNAKAGGYHFLTLPMLKTSPIDGIHINRQAHALLGHSVATWFKQLTQAKPVPLHPIKRPVI